MNKLKKIAFISVAIIMILGFLIVIYLTILLLTDKICVTHYEKAIESTLISNGLSLIGVALTVWAGLNIINAVSRKDIDKAKKDITRLRCSLIKTETKIRNFESIIKDSENKNYKLFLELLSNLPEKEYPSKYFLNHFMQYKPNDSIILEFMILEQKFADVYWLHEHVDDGGEAVKAISDIAIKDISHILENSKNELSGFESLYLKYRLAEFYFYRGYICNNLEDTVSCFKNAITLYMETSPHFGVFIPKYNKNQIYKLDFNNKDLAIYLSNSIGEAYGKIVDKYRRETLNSQQQKKAEEYAYKAVFYCGYSIQMSETAKSFDNDYIIAEVYYRNTGAAYERLDSILNESNKHADKILKFYQKAFEAVRYDERISRVKNVYYSFLSYYKKYFDRLLPIGKYIDSGAVDDTAFKNDKTIKNFNHIYLLKNFCDVSEFGKIHICRNNIPYVMNGFAYEYVVILKLVKNKGVDSQFPYDCDVYMQKIYDDINMLKLLGIDDDYTKALKCRYEILDKIVRKGKNK